MLEKGKTSEFIKGEYNLKNAALTVIRNKSTKKKLKRKKELYHFLF